VAVPRCSRDGARMERSDMPDGLTGMSRSLSKGRPTGSGPLPARWQVRPDPVAQSGYQAATGLAHRNRTALISLGIPKLVRSHKIHHRSFTNRSLAGIFIPHRGPKVMAVSVACVSQSEGAEASAEVIVRRARCANQGNHRGRPRRCSRTAGGPPREGREAASRIPGFHNLAKCIST